jgi:hypothetical protein
VSSDITYHYFWPQALSLTNEQTSLLVCYFIFFAQRISRNWISHFQLLLICTCAIIFSSNPKSLGWFTYHPPLQILAIALITYGEMSHIIITIIIIIFEFSNSSRILNALILYKAYWLFSPRLTLPRKRLG